MNVLQEADKLRGKLDFDFNKTSLKLTQSVGELKKRSKQLRGVVRRAKEENGDGETPVDPRLANKTLKQTLASYSSFFNKFNGWNNERLIQLDVREQLLDEELAFVVKQNQVLTETPVIKPRKKIKQGL